MASKPIFNATAARLKSTMCQEPLSLSERRQATASASYFKVISLRIVKVDCGWRSLSLDSSLVVSVNEIVAFFSFLLG